MIECRDVTKRYKDFTAVRGLNFKVNKGEVFGLLGANGAGKTTTIKMVLGLTNISSGEIVMDRKVKIGYSPETPYFHTFLTGSEVMMFFARIQGLQKKDAVKQIDQILHQVGLSKAADKKVGNYSKGMLQRLAVGQALIGNPELLILDEPTSGLDAIGRVTMKELIGKLKAEGKTIILNSHILSDIERIADRAIIMRDGLLLKEVNLKERSICKNLEEIFIEAIGGNSYDYTDF